VTFKSIPVSENFQLHSPISNRLSLLPLLRKLGPVRDGTGVLRIFSIFLGEE
jgi:hypothetical protein